MERPDRLPRKLAAILYADVAGYSRLTGKDEDTTHLRLSQYLDLIADEVARHGGRVMHYAGDAVLAMFEAVADALLCAAQMQRSLQTHNADIPDEQKVQFRIGVNLGDVIKDRGDIYGDGVNIAARLEGLAEPGGICVSGSVCDAVGRRLPFDYAFLGEQQVKNIEQPVRAYAARVKAGAELPKPAVRRGWSEDPEQDLKQAREHVAQASAIDDNKPSIAVLAFDNLSGDPDQEYFTDGLSENVITRLYKVTGMFVIARNSSFKYKGRQIDVRQIGKELGVRHVLEGSVLREGDRIRVNAQLIDAVTGHQLWAEQYDRELNDLFAVLDDITLKVVTQLEVTLTMGDHARVIAHGTDSVAALENLLLARQAFFKFDRESLLRSRELARKAVELDPNFAWAIAQEGFSHTAELIFGMSRDRGESLRQAESLARQALAADPELQLAYSLLGRVYALRDPPQHEEALAALRRAVELSPNDAYPIGMLSHQLVWVGQPEEAVVLINKALRLEPYPSATMLNFAGEAYYFSGQYGEAIRWFRKQLEHPQTGAQALISWQYMIASHVELGQMEEARNEACKLLGVNPDFTIAAAAQLIRSAPFKDHSFLDHHVELLRESGLPEGDDG